MCKIEIESKNIDSETGEFSDSSEESSETESAEELKERVGNKMEILEGRAAASISKEAGRQLDKGMEGLGRQNEVAKNLREMRKFETHSNSEVKTRRFDKEKDPMPVEPKWQAKEQRGIDMVEAENNSAENNRAVNSKQIIFLRFKFWVLFFGVTSTMIAGALGYWLSKRDQTPPPDLPDEAKQAIDRKLELWKTMPLEQFFSKLRDFILVWSMSPTKQSYVVNQFMAVTEQPEGLAAITYLDIVTYVDELLDGYHKATAPKSIILYSLVKNLTRADEGDSKKTRKISKHEGLYIISVALAQIMAFDGSGE